MHCLASCCGWCCCCCCCCCCCRCCSCCCSYSYWWSLLPSAKAQNCNPSLLLIFKVPPVILHRDRWRKLHPSLPHTVNCIRIRILINYILFTHPPSLFALSLSLSLSVNGRPRVTKSFLQSSGKDWFFALALAVSTLYNWEERTIRLTMQKGWTLRQ